MSDKSIVGCPKCGKFELTYFKIKRDMYLHCTACGFRKGREEKEDKKSK